MIRKSEISDTTLLIIVRFFAALHRVKKDRKIRGVQTFCHAHGINRRNLYTLEHDIRGHSGMFDVSWLAFLVADHDVNPRWLLTGEGEFYDPIFAEKTQNQRKPIDGDL